jgi:hypothetical protein
MFTAAQVSTSDGLARRFVAHLASTLGPVFAENLLRHYSIRVAKKAIFLSDSNRFGRGSHTARLLKIALYKTGLWQAARFVQTKGKMYTISEGDGLQYSYSVFDSYYQLVIAKLTSFLACWRWFYGWRRQSARVRTSDTERILAYSLKTVLAWTMAASLAVAAGIYGSRVLFDGKASSATGR